MAGGLPIELLEEIVLTALHELPERSPPSGTRTEPGARLQKRPEKFRNIAGFSRACRRYREIALRMWFRDVCLQSPEDWEMLNYVPQVFKWIRAITFPVTSCCVSGYTFGRFTNLRTVSVHIGSAQAVDPWQSILDEGEYIIGILPPSIRQLKIRAKAWPIVYLFEQVVHRLPKLEELAWEDVTTLGSHEEHRLQGYSRTSMEEIESFPIEIAAALQPLHYLHTLSLQYLAVPLSFAEHWHLEHAPDDEDEDDPPFVACGTLCLECAKKVLPIAYQLEDIMPDLIAQDVLSLRRIVMGSWQCLMGESVFDIWREGPGSRLMIKKTNVILDRLNAQKAALAAEGMEQDITA